MSREPLVFELSAELSEAERIAVLRRWRTRARSLGGDAWRITQLQVGVGRNARSRS